MTPLLSLETGGINGLTNGFDMSSGERLEQRKRFRVKAVSSVVG
ncbi:MAG: hypothetical protein ACKVQW_03985 [Pyrinomonadaceae bacterium]